MLSCSSQISHERADLHNYTVHTVTLNTSFKHFIACLTIMHSCVFNSAFIKFSEMQVNCFSVLHLHLCEVCWFKSRWVGIVLMEWLKAVRVLDGFSQYVFFSLWCGLVKCLQTRLRCQQEFYMRLVILVHVKARGQSAAVGKTEPFKCLLMLVKLWQI